MNFKGREKLSRPQSGFKFGMTMTHPEIFGMQTMAKGQFIIEMHDAKTGVLLESRVLNNVITLDAGIQAARLFKDNVEPSNGANMLAIGSGALGPLLSPDAPDPAQRKLNAEIERKAFSTTLFRDASGNAVSIPTNVVDFTTTYGEAEAVGPLNEMGILSTISNNAAIKNPNPDTWPTRDLTVDLTQYDVLINYLTFSVITKPSTAILTITWRLSF